MVENQNPDNYNFFNYAAYYSWDDMNPGSFLTSVTLETWKELTVASSACDPSCARCFNTQNTACLVCNDGWGVRSHDCVATNPAYYYYKNPPKNPVPKLGLKVTPYNLSSNPALTILWFMKIYSFTDLNFDMIIFDSTRDFRVTFNDDMTSVYGAVETYYSGVMQYQYQQYRETLFGRWIPMSIAMYREYEPWLYPNMHSMSIYNTLLDSQDYIVLLFVNYSLLEI